jgi:glycosyltransferase involved in cell wall biosynthesis
LSTSCFIASGCPIVTTTLYRCIHLREQLHELGHEARVAEWFEETSIDIDEALRSDVIFLYRLAMSPPLRRLIDRAHELHKPVIFDTDDLIFEPDLIEQHRAVRNLTPSDQIQHAEGVRRYLETLQACDTVVTATPLLAEFARRRGKPAYVHRNSLGQEMLAHANRLFSQRRQQPRRDQVVIGYGSGTPTHDVDFQEATAALITVLDRFRHAQLWIAGPLTIASELERFGTRVRRFPLTDWRAWFELAAKMDIAIAPLEQNNVFSRAKSEIKFVEAGALGVPLVASKSDPFRDSITEGEDGLLATGEMEWTRALTSLIEQPERRARIGERAREMVLQRHSPAARTHDLANLLPQLAPSWQTAPTVRGANKHRSGPTVPRVSGKGQTDHLTINWLIPEPIAGAGGDVGIFRIIRHLAEFGHDCQVHVVPYQTMAGFSTEQIRGYVRQHFGETLAHYHRWDGYIENADCTFATFWPTVENLTGLLKGGRRYYLVQDFEPSFYPGDPHHTRRAENTYRAGLHCITLGPWLAKLLRARYGATADHFDFAVDTAVYSPRPVEHSANHRVCFYARPETPRRGYELGLEALRLLQARLPKVEIVLYGTAKLQPQPAFSFVDRGLLSQEDLAALFSSCDVGLVLSLSNPSFVPLEMMACQCAVVELASERLEGIATHGEDAWLVEPNPDAIADGLARLLEDAPLRGRLIENAYQRVRGMDWRHSARQIEAVLLRYA